MLQWRSRHAVLIAALVVVASVVAGLGGYLEESGLFQFNW